MTGHKDTMALPLNLKQRPMNLEAKETGNDRILKLKKMEGLKARDSYGMVDPGVFEGKNNLHAIYDQDLQLWYLKYEQGGLPPPLKQHFTSYGAVVKHCKRYFAGRNIDIIDA